MANRPSAERVFAQLEIGVLLVRFAADREWEVFLASASRAWMLLMGQLRDDMLATLSQHEDWKQRSMALAEFEDDPLGEAYYAREARRQGLIADEPSDSS